MADKIYSSIQIVCALKRLFPDLVVQKIRYYTKLAIDLNGYTVEELKEFVKTRKEEISDYTKKKYRRAWYNLKRYQVVHVVQTVNIEIPILQYTLGNYYRVCNIKNIE